MDIEKLEKANDLIYAIHQYEMYLENAKKERDKVCSLDKREMIKVNNEFPSVYRDDIVNLYTKIVKDVQIK